MLIDNYIGVCQSCKRQLRRPWCTCTVTTAVAGAPLSPFATMGNNSYKSYLLASLSLEVLELICTTSKMKFVSKNFSGRTNSIFTRQGNKSKPKYCIGMLKIFGSDQPQSLN
jgi:hypothetical protein